MLKYKRAALAARSNFGIGPYMATITSDGVDRDDLTEGYYWRHLRKPLLKQLVKGANALAPEHPDYCNNPEKATRDTYERLIFEVLHVLQDEIGGLIVVVRE